MKLCVISPKGCTESAQELAEALGATYCNPYKADRRDFRGYDAVFNYGCARLIYTNKVVNHYQAVAKCIDKLTTFQKLKEAGLAHPAFVTRNTDVPPAWNTVVVRQTATGRANEGMSYTYQSEGEKCPVGALFTEYFPHEWEYRIVVYQGKIVGRYRKERTKDETWKFVLLQRTGFKAIDTECVKAAAVLGIDYVGFDVVENDRGQFVILEANSGPVLTEEAKAVIVKSFKG